MRSLNQTHRAKGGRPGRGPGLWGTGYGVEVGDSIPKWVDVETYFFRHEHDSCAAAILRAFLWINQATMGVIILSPPYSFSDLHLSRPGSRLFYSTALRCLLIYGRCRLQSEQTKGALSFDLVQECNRKRYFDLVLDLYSPSGNFHRRNAEFSLL
jgi:hypothetical protein